MTLLRGVRREHPGGDVEDDPGRAVQVDPMKPKLKPPGTKRLKLKCDILLSTLAFKFNLRRYIQVRPGGDVFAKDDQAGRDGSCVMRVVCMPRHQPCLNPRCLSEVPPRDAPSIVVSVGASCTIRRGLMYYPSGPHVLSVGASCIIRRGLMYYPSGLHVVSVVRRALRRGRLLLLRAGGRGGGVHEAGDGGAGHGTVRGRGLHSSTSQLNLSRFCH